MKKIILTAGICLIGLVYVKAQTSVHTIQPSNQTQANGLPIQSNGTVSPADHQTASLMDRLTRSCQLTPEQAAKAKPIVAQYVNDKMANRQQYGSDPAKLSQAMDASVQRMKTGLNGILSPAQQAQLENSRNLGQSPVQATAAQK